MVYREEKRKCTVDFRQKEPLINFQENQKRREFRIESQTTPVIGDWLKKKKKRVENNQTEIEKKSQGREKSGEYDIKGKKALSNALQKFKNQVK